MTEVEVTGNVVWKKFEPVSYNDKKTGDPVNTMKGVLVVEYEKEWADKRSGEMNKAKSNVAFDFFGKQAEEANKVEVGQGVKVAGNA